MHAFFLFFLLILVLGAVLGPKLLAWYVKRRFKKFMQQAVGVPPHASDNKKKKKQGTNSNKAKRRRQGKIIPPEYAVDAEYTVYTSYQSETVTAQDNQGNKVKYKIEEQVSDVEWTEIKSPSHKKC